MKTTYFNGPFAPLCELFVAQKRAAGLDYTQQARLLHRFDDFCKEYSIQDYTITEEIALAWCELRPNEKEVSRHGRVSEMRRFSIFLTKQGYPSFFLADLPKKGAQHSPYIFSKEEMRRIFQRLDTLKHTNISPCRHLAFPLIIRILYGCGLRISEVLALLKSDVNTEKGILHIRHGKNDRERIVPMSLSLVKACISYISKAHLDTPNDISFFHTKKKAAYTQSAIGSTFRGFLWDVGIPYRGKEFGPRLHDLRHTFICHNIQQWTEQGIPIQTMLPILSKYVGHTSISATQWYLRLTSEIYPHLRNVCEHELGGMYAGLSRQDIGGSDDE